ncbi:MAG: four helix bundle protein [Bacteroidales bacterium]|nr:four helix bundle protein [Bacteroidales bacterium]
MIIIMKGFQDLTVYKEAFRLAMQIFELSKEFPKEEKYSLTDQIRRSSRSVCSNIAEAFRKRQYPKQFVNKLSDSDAESSETLVWLDFALSCKYISTEVHKELVKKNSEIGKMLGAMIKYPDKFIIKKNAK